MLFKVAGTDLYPSASPSFLSAVAPEAFWLEASGLRAFLKVLLEVCGSCWSCCFETGFQSFESTQSSRLLLSPLLLVLLKRIQFVKAFLLLFCSRIGACRFGLGTQAVFQRFGAFCCQSVIKSVSLQLKAYCLELVIEFVLQRFQKLDAYCLGSVIRAVLLRFQTLQLSSLRISSRGAS